MEEGSNCHKWLMIICALGMYLSSLVATILMYVFYTKNTDGGSNCGVNKFVITWNMLTSLALTILGLSSRVQVGAAHMSSLCFTFREPWAFLPLCGRSMRAHHPFTIHPPSVLQPSTIRPPSVHHPSTIHHLFGANEMGVV
jgi:hypothetical protein